MVLGLSNLKQAAKNHKREKSASTPSIGDSAADLLSKMDAKAAAGICPFC